MGGEREFLLKGMRWGWDRKFFGELLGQNFSISHHEQCISFFGRGGGGAPQNL